MISFADIYKINHKAVTRAPRGGLASLEDVLAVDCQVRDEIQSELGFTKGEAYHGYQQAGVTS
jgi:1-deoxy-D-xylulose 5-phosphate reductoisomerase